MRAPEAIILFTNAAAGTAAAVGVNGGRYLFLLACTGTPSCQIQVQDPSANWVKVGAAFVTASGGSFELALPPGQVRAIITTSTANYLSAGRIPND